MLDIPTFIMRTTILCDFFNLYFNNEVKHSYAKLGTSMEKLQLSDEKAISVIKIIKEFSKPYLWKPSFKMMP